MKCLFFLDSEKNRYVVSIITHHQLDNGGILFFLFEHRTSVVTRLILAIVFMASPAGPSSEAYSPAQRLQVVVGR